ncbi:MAG TPA: dipeptide epimerase [Rhizomicrobium sp.]|jgi:L-alanine-DL-glutamate epimerase-like enolase superfamily enzyme
MKVHFRKESWALKKPFRFAGHTIAASDVVIVELRREDHVGRGEATGVIYRGETPDTICEQIAAVVDRLTDETTPQALREILPWGGARNAIDCALWDLLCKETGKTIWQVLDIAPRPVATVNTVGLDPIAEAAVQAESLAAFPLLKVKLDANDPLRRLSAIRAARPDARIIVDANQSWDLTLLRDVVQPLAALGVEMIEQPLPAGRDEGLADFVSPIPLYADESCFVAADVAGLKDRYQGINIKLDKSGGLTEALDMVRAAKDCGLSIMVGNMIGTSLSMAPNHVIAQFCRWVDMDGPLALVHDREHGLFYDGPLVSPPTRELWG